MFAVISLIIVLTISLLITRIATVALTLTGLSRHTAQFQARSAFTGVGFTTNEAETVVNHPLRRRILMLLMLLGNAGVVTSISYSCSRFSATVGRQAGSGACSGSSSGWRHSGLSRPAVG